MNEKIRIEAKRNGVFLWEVADRLELTDGNFSRKLRRELPEEDQARILGIIHSIAIEREEENGEN